MMPRAYARSNAASIRRTQCTDGRTDGLTENRVTRAEHLAFRNAHAHAAKQMETGMSETCRTASQRRIWAARQITRKEAS